MHATKSMVGVLVLSDGTIVEGGGAGAPGVAVGELVFQTGMVGYQEALTDPSYAGQLLIFTYPLVGNYGAGPLSSQSAHVHPRGVVMRDLMESAGHRNSDNSLDAMLRLHGIPALTGRGHALPYATGAHARRCSRRHRGLPQDSAAWSLNCRRWPRRSITTR